MANPPRKKGPRKTAPKRKAPAAVKRKAAAPVRRPPEVTRAEWTKWSASYRKRAAGFYAKHPGAPRYQMRGKAAAEHLTRKAKLEARMEALADRQSYRGERQGARDADSIVESYQALIRDKGEGAFGHLERLIRSRQKGEGRITSDELDFDWSDYGGDDSELFYN